MTPSVNPAPGETRICPHCKATILRSAPACPACHHFLRFEAVKGDHKAPPSFEPLRIEGTIRGPIPEKAAEYSVLVAVRNDLGEEIARQVVDVGSLSPSETRTFSVWVEVYVPENVSPAAQARPSAA